MFLNKVYDLVHCFHRHLKQMVLYSSRAFVTTTTSLPAAAQAIDLECDPPNIIDNTLFLSSCQNFIIIQIFTSIIRKSIGILCTLCSKKMLFFIIKVLPCLSCCGLSTVRTRFNKGRGFYSKIIFPAKFRLFFKTHDCTKFNKMHLLWVIFLKRLLFRSVFY